MPWKEVDWIEGKRNKEKCLVKKKKDTRTFDKA
jgi:hypothetical protein